MSPPTNKGLNDSREQFCIGVTPERKYYKYGTTWIKRSLRPTEWQKHNGYTHIPLFNLERVLNEGACLQFLAKNTSIPIPKLYACFEDDGAAYLITEYVEGVSMNELDDEKQGIVAQELQTHMDTLATLKSNKWGGFVDMVIPPYRIMQHANGKPWRMRPRDKDDLVFCHNDLSANNVIVNPDTLKIAAIVDWEYAGFFPPKFEVPYFRRSGPSIPLEGEFNDVNLLMDMMAQERE